MKRKISFFLLVSFILVLSFAQGSEENAKVDLKKVADKLLKTIKSHDAAAMSRIYAEDAMMTMPGEPEPVRGRKAIEENMAGWFRAFPTVKMEFSTVLISENYIVIEWVWQGPHTGPLASPEGDIPATGRDASLKGVMLLRVSPEGLIEEDRTYYDTADLMKQLGLME